MKSLSKKEKELLLKALETNKIHSLSFMIKTPLKKVYKFTFEEGGWVGNWAVFPADKKFTLEQIFKKLGGNLCQKA